MLIRSSFAFLFLGCLFTLINTFSSKLPDSFSLSQYAKGKTDFFPLIINCENPETGYLTFNSRVVAHRSFISFASLEITPQKLAHDQLKFFDGFADHSAENGYRFIPHQVKEVELLDVKKIRYPLSLFLDKIELNNNYYPDIFHNKWFHHGDEALEVSYKARVKVTRCLESNSDANNFYELILPLDPYLAFWYVPKDKRIEVKIPPAHKILTTPCASPIMAELKYPNMYWNVWKPKATGNGYDCKELLQENVHKITTKADFVPIATKAKNLEFSHLKKKEKVRVSLISGFLFPVDTEINLNKVRPLLKSINSIESIKQELLKEQDVAVLATFTFMNLVKKLSKNIDWKVEDHGDHFVFRSSGNLQLSSKALELEIYLGPSVEYQQGRKHWSFLANALNSSDIIFYSGHSGMGTTFTLKNLRGNSNFTSFEAAPDNQFIAVLSCSSISYFGDDFIGERKKQGKVTDLLLTGFDNNSYRLIPAMIQYIDLELA